MANPRNAPGLEYDKRILLIVVVLMAIGASLVASSSSHFSAAKFSDPYFLLKRHLVRIVIAGLFLVVAMHLDYRFFKRLSPLMFLGGLAMLGGLFVVGHVIRDTARWYYIDALKLTFQPAEFARLSLVLFLAYWFGRMGHEITDLKRGFLPAAVAIVLVVGLMAAQPNYGTATATAIIAFLMLFLGGARLHHILGFGTLLTIVAVLRVMSVPYVRERFVAYFSRGEDLQAMNWQPLQSLIGLGAGGLLGTGLGQSKQKLSWLPDSHTDFIFSILGEEMGLVGTVVVSFLFLLIVLRALKTSQKSTDTFGEMTVIGIGCSIFVYAMLNILVATGLFPVTGLPLPFLSYGGSALLVNAFSIGILLNVSRKSASRAPSHRHRARRPKERLCVS